MKKIILLIFVVVILNACVSQPKNNPPISPTLNTSRVSIEETSTQQPSQWSVKEIMDIIIASNPQSSTYDPSSKISAEYSAALHQLEKMGVDALKDKDLNLSVIADAIAYPRRDSTLAGNVLITFDPEHVGTTMDILIGHLANSRSEVRKYSVILLGFIGDQASCAVGNIAPLLWDKDASVRSASAAALSNILNKDFVPDDYKISANAFSTNPIPNDDPEGSLTDKARAWWNDDGSKINWHPSYDLCDP